MLPDELARHVPVLKAPLPEGWKTLDLLPLQQRKAWFEYLLEDGSVERGGTANAEFLMSASKRIGWR
jgi:hypothetical protein